MSNSPQHVRLPSHLAYVGDAAKKYAIHQGWLDRYNAMIDGLSKDQLGEITALYNRIADSNHATELAAWVSSFWASEGKSPELPQQVFEIFGIFELLADRGIAPFRCWRVEFIQPLPAMDWTKLPKELSYLIKPAEKYGVFNTNKAAARAGSRLTESERSELEQLSKRLRRSKDVAIAQKWLQEHSDLEHKEAECVVYLFQVMEEAGIRTAFLHQEFARVLREFARVLQSRIQGRKK
jgi:hypothetical protein